MLLTVYIGQLKVTFDTRTVYLSPCRIQVSFDELTEKMNKRRPNDVFSEVDKMLLTYKTVGLCALTYSQGEFKISKKRSIISFMTLSPFIFTNIFIAVYMWLMVDNSLDSFLDAARLISVVISLSLAWLMNHTRLGCLNRSLRKIQVIDYYLFSVGERVPPSKPSKMILSMIATITLPFSVYLFTFPSYGSWMFGFVVFYPYILMLMVQLFLDRLCTILFLRYHTINNVLQRCLSVRQGRSAAVLLEKMVFCYENLCSSSESINYFFSLQILFILTSVFIMSFSEAYAILRILYYDFFYSKKLTIILHGCGFFITFQTIWRFGHTFSTITKEVCFNNIK